MQLEHKNYRVREGSLQAIKGTAQVVDISSMCGILGKLVGLLSDKQPSVRQLAVETIGSLYSTFGDTLMVIVLGHYYYYYAVI